MEIKRGEIYYVHPTDAVGSENHAGRPAVIVSNDIGNKYGVVVEVVYLTTQKKRPLPTHVPLTSMPSESTAMCEQVHSVSKERIGEFYAKCTAEELSAIDNALMVSLGLKIATKSNENAKVEETGEKGKEIELKAKLELYKGLYERLLERHVTAKAKAKVKMGVEENEFV